MTDKIKRATALAGIVVAAIFIGIIMYGQGQKRAYQQDIGALKVLVSQLETKVKISDAAIVIKNEELSRKEKERLAAISDADKSHGQVALLKAENDKLKTETAALPATALSRNINARIGLGNSWPTAGGLFSFTRVGTENTLNLFLDGESAVKQGGEYLLEISKLRSAVSIAETEIKIRDEKYALRDGEYIALWAAFDARGDALKHLERSILGRRVKSFVIGAGVGAAAVIIYNVIVKEP